MRFSIFLCFFLRIRLRRFLISDPMARRTLVAFVTLPFSRRYLGGLAPDHVRLAIGKCDEERRHDFFVGLLGIVALSKPLSDVASTR